MESDNHDFESLVSTLRDFAEFLRLYGEERWAAWMDEDRESIERGDAKGLSHLLSAFGGMGSLNDLRVRSINGHAVPERDVESVNQRLQALSSRVFDLASAQKRQVDIAGIE